MKKDFDTSAPKRLAMINDIAGFGRCSTTVSLPVISAMEVQVCPVPTSVLSNHLGFPICHVDDYTPHMREYLQAWRELGLTFDGLYCGFLGSMEQVRIVEEFLEWFRPPLFLLDPVMGDHGKLYSGIAEEHCERLRELAGKADILTPNVTEACLLTDTPFQADPSEQELHAICQKLSQHCPGSIVITGLEHNGQLINFILENEKESTYATPRAGASRPGTGDLFASILAADALHGRNLASSVRKAADFISLCIRGSEQANVPVAEGVIFEKYLRELM